MPLIVVLRLALLPILLVLALVYGIIILFFIRETILDGHDKTLRAITGSVAAFVDVDEHRQIMQRHAVSGLAYVGDQCIALNDAGALLSLDMSDEDKLAQASVIRASHGSLQLYGNLCVDDVGHLYALYKESSQHGIARIRLTEQGPIVEKTKAQCSSHHGQVIWRRADKKLYVLEFQKTLQGVDPDTGDWDKERTVFSDSLTHICSDGDEIFAARGSLYFKIAIGNPVLEAMELGSFELDEEDYSVNPQTRLGIACDQEHLYVCADRLYVCQRADLNLINIGYPGYRTEQVLPYKRYVEAFNGIRTDTKITYLYSCALQGKDSEIIYGLDASNYEDDEGNTLIGELDSEVAHDDLKQAWFLHGAQFTDIEHWDEWGWIKSGFWPIIDNDGQTVAIIGGDIRADEIISKMNQATVVIGAIQVVLVLLVLLVTVLTSRRISRKLELIKDAALMLAAGRFNQNISYDLPPELEQLARQLNKYGADLMTLEKENMWKSERITRV